MLLYFEPVFVYCFLHNSMNFPGSNCSKMTKFYCFLLKTVKFIGSITGNYSNIGSNLCAVPCGSDIDAILCRR
jgi:hypothetical protein